MSRYGSRMDQYIWKLKKNLFEELLNFLRHCQTAFQSNCTILHSHQQCTKLPVSPHPHQHLLVLPITAILVDVKWYFTAVSVYISIMTTDVEPLFNVLGFLFVIELWVWGFFLPNIYIYYGYFCITSLDCCNKFLKVGWLKTHLLSHASGSEKFEIKVSTGPCSVWLL